MKHAQCRYPLSFLMGSGVLATSLVGCSGAAAISYTGNIAISQVLTLLFAACSIMAYLFFWRARHFIEVTNARQYLVCYLVALIFVCSSLFGINRNTETIDWGFAGLTLVIVLGGSLWWATQSRLPLLCYSIREKGRPKQWLSMHWPVMVLILLVIAISVDEFDRGVKWDSAAYYRFLIGMEDFTFNPADIFLFKKAGNHLSYSFTLVYSIGYYLFPDPVVGVRCVSVFLLVASVVLFWGVLKRLFPDNLLVVTLSTCFLAFCPSIIGPLHEINPELATLCFFICFLYCFLAEKKILQCFFGILLVFSKELGVLYLFCFALGWLIWGIIQAKRTKVGRFVDFVVSNRLQIMIFFIPCFMFLLQFMINPVAWGFTSAKVPAGFENADILNTVGLNKVIIIGKLKQLFLMNFNWLAWLLIVVFVCSALVFNRATLKSLWQRTCGLLVPLGFVYMGFLANQFFYMTYTFPRYIAMNALFVGVIYAFVCVASSMRNWIKGVLSAAVAVSMCAQIFISVDPVTNRIFKTIDVGEAQIITTADVIAYSSKGYMIETGKASERMLLSPYTYYNRQWGYFDNLIEGVLKEIGYEPGDLIVLPNLFDSNSPATYWGWCTDNYYDPSTGKVYQRYGDDRDYSNMVAIEFAIVGNANDLEKIDTGSYRRIFYINFPFSLMTAYTDDFLFDEFDVKREFEFSKDGWTAFIYELEKKGE